jgi:hypothetical protein
MSRKSCRKLKGHAMPVNDWSLVDAGIFHAFHHGWIEELARALNRGILPADYYALPEQHAAGFGPDVLTLTGAQDREDDSATTEVEGGHRGLLVAQPKLTPTAESDLEFYRRRQTPIVVRHVSGDRVVAMIEVVSPGNKSSRYSLRSFVDKAAELLDRRIHLLILDLLPPGPRDSNGIHAAIWEEVTGQHYALPQGKPVTLVAYEAALTVRAYVRAMAVGSALPEMPLFLKPNGCVDVPLETTYQAAFAAMPVRWKRVLEPRT